ncbi:tetratricopeptide repeat protein [Gilvimarinus sp. SDUM040013]|uniref:Tetratricopeptide repeat protein n=1 Tax=Gilvimarinus gilvus TaxID=3058038 RepID=A0ABU4RUG1_9GAMM|nr:tetratricopeptide repeat protein [Gilvimarinus sp. SDUM040013]MDO3388613.1 tetratricopeptide repeat protein [Gilvimarinus sp. SDUM040013]MDX6848515.1 tetratricopeptide repeat protein [Gilvimarinus sp. SDUM040013]
MKYLLSLILLCSVGAQGISVQEQSPDVKITLAPTEFVIPRFSNPFSNRESSIPPHEYEYADSLRALLDADDKQEALTSLNTLFEFEMSPALLHLKGQIYFALEDYKNAETTFLMVLARVPQLVRGHSDIGQLYLVTNQLEKARKHFSLAVKYGEYNPIVLGQLGYLNLQLHNPMSAVMAYQTALTMEPDNKQWQNGLLSALSLSGQIQSASSLLNEMIKQTPDDVNLWLNRAFNYLNQDDYFNALSSLETAMELGENTPENVLAAIRLHFQLSSHARGYELATTYFSEHGMPVDIAYEVTNWLTHYEKFNEVEAVLNQLQKNGDLSQAEMAVLASRRAVLLHQRKQIDAAKKLHEQALALAPADGKILLDAAKFYFAIDQLARADTLYSRAKSFPQSRQHAMLGQIKVYIELKEYPHALRLMRDTYQEFPGLYELKDNIALLESTIAAQKL